MSKALGVMTPSFSNALAITGQLPPLQSARLGRLPPSPDCPGLRRAIDAVIAEEVREGNRRDLEIDRRTRHGELDGVRLP